MSAIATTTDPARVGLDAERLTRITRHFDAYVDDGRLAGWLAVVARRGEVAYVGMGGHRDREAGAPMTADTVFRIYSMTKPITQVALMRLWEEGRFELNDPIAPYLGCFEAPQVFVGGTAEHPETRPAIEPIRVWHLMMHMAGLTYGFQHEHVVDEIYRNAGYDFGSPGGADIAQACHDWAALPILFDPGTSWNYSVATDVLGRLIEVLTGETLDVALRRLVLDPLGMDETGFFCPASAADRLAQLYIPDFGHSLTAVPVAEMGQHALRQPAMLSGGGGLVSTAADYRRFTAMLLGGGQAGGARLLSPRTLAYMTRNHLPGGADLLAMATDSFSETNYAGVGFGLGFAVVEDAAPSHVPTTEGSFSWGRGVDGVLGGSDRGDGGLLLHPAPAKRHAPDPISAQPARLPGHSRLRWGPSSVSSPTPRPGSCSVGTHDRWSMACAGSLTSAST